jgi:hypothetical protein
MQLLQRLLIAAIRDQEAIHFATFPVDAGFVDDPTAWQWSSSTS